MSTTWFNNMDKDGKTPLDRAFNCGHRAVADMMIHQERDDQTGNPGGVPPLHRAAGLGLTEAVLSLLSYGANPAARDTQGEIPLHKAVREGHLCVVEALLDVSNVNVASNTGLTPLHWACLTGQTEIARALLDHGADPWLRNEAMDGLTPVDVAAVMEYGDICDLFEKRPCFV